MKTMLAGFAVWAVVLSSPATVVAMDKPEGEVILTVSGAIGETNADDKATFDLAMLESMPPTSFTTTTIWTDGEQTFTGVSLQELLQAVSADGDSLRAVALNDYAVEIPIADAVEGGPIVAYLLNGQPMSVRDKGPLWIVYPYDSNTDYQAEVIYSRSIWQLRDIEVQG